MSANTAADVVVEVLYLDEQTCEPCRAARDAVVEAAEVLEERLRGEGRELVVRRTHVTDRARAAALGFTSSPTVRVDGVDIELEVHEQPCASCSALAGTPVDCRTFAWRGERYASPPADMIVERVLEHLAGTRRAPGATEWRAGSVDRFLTARGAVEG